MPIVNDQSTDPTKNTSPVCSAVMPNETYKLDDSVSFVQPSILNHKDRKSNKDRNLKSSSGEIVNSAPK